MAHFTGTSEDDILPGTTGKDRFDISQGGEDTVTADDGDDLILAGGAFDTGDRIDGGNGFDTLVLNQNGNTTVFDAATLTNVERILLKVGNFDFTLDEATAANGASLTIDAHRADSLTLDTTADTDAAITVLGTRAGDTIQGGSGTSAFDGGRGDDQLFAAGGTGTLSGGAGDDFIGADGNYDVRGGAGNDSLGFGDSTFTGHAYGGHGIDSIGFSNTVFDVDRYHLPKNIEFVEFTPNFQLGTDNDNAVNLSRANSQVLFAARGGDDRITGTSDNFGDWLAGEAGNDVLFGGPGSDSMDGGTGHNRVYGGDGDDALGIPVFADGLGGNSALYGDAGNDGLFGYDGHYKLYGGDGDDYLTFRNCVVKDGEIDGGDGTDLFSLEEAGTVLDFVLFDAATAHLEQLKGGAVAGSHRANVLDFSGFALTTSDGVTVDGRGGGDTLIGTAIADVLSGSGGDDRLVGGAGADTLDGGRGHDVFAYAAVSESNGTAYDTILGFDARHDSVDLWFAVNAIDADVISGALNAATLNADLHAAIGKDQLGVNDAVMFTPDAGDLAGTTFLIVDANGKAGYQADADLVFLLAAPEHLGQLNTASFI